MPLTHCYNTTEVTVEINTSVDDYDKNGEHWTDETKNVITIVHDESEDTFALKVPDAERPLVLHREGARHLGKTLLDLLDSKRRVRS